MSFENVDVLASFADRFTEGARLTPSERAEVLRVAQGLGCKASAEAANVSPETIRARRKRIYRKLDVVGAHDIIARLLALSLTELGGRSGLTREHVTQASASL